jgi:pyruvate dehydrogenase E1 component beta subunit
MRELSYRDALNETLRAAMRADPTMMILGEDIGRSGGIFGVTRGLVDEFGPVRIRETPVSEVAIVGAALGIAVTGVRAVAEIMHMDFTLVAMDQIANQVAKFRYMSGGRAAVPLVLRTQCGGYRGGAAQHSQNLEALFLHIPGLKIAIPSTAYEAKGLLVSALREPNPVLFLEHRHLYAKKALVPDGEYAVPFGEARVWREGRDVTIVATAFMLEKAMAAAETLHAEGVEAEIIDPRTLVPLDLDSIVASVERTHRLVVVHEAVRRGGYGAELAAELTERAFDHLDAPVARVGARPVPVPYSRPLEQHVLPLETDIVEAVRAVLATV